MSEEEVDESNIILSNEEVALVCCGDVSLEYLGSQFTALSTRARL